MSYNCHTDSNQLKLQSIGISVDKDKKDVHPQLFCHSCYNVCTRAIKASAEGKDYTHHVHIFEWVEHTGTDCSVCRHFGEQKRGRKPKRSSIGRPPQKVVDLVSKFKERSSPSLLLDFQLRERMSQLHEDLNCPICHLVVDRPILITTCNKIVCLTCCVEHMYKHTNLSCPFCGLMHLLDESTVIPAPPVILKLLKSLEIPCEKCAVSVSAGMSMCNLIKYVVPSTFLIETFQEHICADNSPMDQAVDDVVAEVVAKSPDTPLSSQEDKLATSLVRRKLAHGSENGVVHFKTGGQVKSKQKHHVILTC